jgi:hypothetical protein
MEHEPLTGIRLYLAPLFSIIFLAVPFAAAAEVLDYNCSVGEVEISLHIDTETQTVRQIVRAGSVTEVGQYSDGVYGPISHAGAAAALIPPVHQFVLITEEAIRYGAELRGMKDVATLNRHLATLTLASGRSGWCSQRNTILETDWLKK